VALVAGVSRPWDRSQLLATVAAAATLLPGGAYSPYTTGRDITWDGGDDQAVHDSMSDVHLVSAQQTPMCLRPIRPGGNSFYREPQAARVEVQSAAATLTEGSLAVFQGGTKAA
jgi:hypothetical protein